MIAPAHRRPTNPSSARAPRIALAVLLALLPGQPRSAGAAQAEDAALPVPAGVTEPTPEAAAAAHAAGDPLEPMNRAIFTFNEKVDAWVLRPVAVGWDKVIPTPVEHGLDNAFENIRFPIHLVNNALQGKIDATGTTIFRFLINSTIGIGGFFDVAKHLGMPRHNADFGQTLGVWGVPPGPYLVWPLLGASCVRDSAGMAVDSYINISGLFVDWPYLAGQRVLETVNSRALLLEEIDRAREASFDFYVAVRAAYEARRAAAITGRSAAARKVAEEDLYFPDTGEPAAGGAPAPAGETR